MPGIYFLLILFFTSNPLLAQEIEAKEQLVLPNFESKLFNPVANEQLRSVLLRIAAKQQAYHLLLQGKDLNSQAENLRSIDLEYKKLGGKRLGIEASIIDLKTGKKIKRVFKKEFHQRELIRTSELALEVLFNLKPAKVLESTKRKQKARPIRSSKPKPPKNENLIAFRERIVSIKSDIAKEYGERNKRKKDENASEGGDEPSKTRNNKKKSASSAALLKNQAEVPKDPDPIDREKKWELDYLAFTGLESQNFEVADQKGSVAEVAIRTNIQYLKLGGEAMLRSLKLQNAKLFFSAEYLVPVVEDEQVEGSSALNYGLGGKFMIQSIYSEIGLAIEKQALMFGSLPEVGGGLKLADFSLYWATISGEFFGGEKWSVYGSFSLLLSAQAGNEFSSPEEFEAAKFNLGAYLDTSFFWKGSGLSASLESLQFVNQYHFGTEGEALNLGLSFEKRF